MSARQAVAGMLHDMRIFHDVFSHGEPSARCGRSGRAVGASRRAVRSWDALRSSGTCPAEACFALASTGHTGLLLLRARIMHACTAEAVLGGL